MTRVLLIGMMLILPAYGIVNIDGQTLTLGSPQQSEYTGPFGTPTLVDQIDLASISVYCWGITYDWDRDGLWITQFTSAQQTCYCIQKTSPCTVIDQFNFGSGAPSYRLGLGYLGSDHMHMVGYNSYIYDVDIATGNCTQFRSLPWSGAEGLGSNIVDDAIYPCDWGADQWGWAQPAQSGSWNTVSLTNVSGASGAHSGTASPAWLFVCDEASPGYFYQHQLTSGVPNTTPVDAWQYNSGQSQTSTADCAFDGQYIYVLDQQSNDYVFVYDIGLPAVGENPKQEITSSFSVTPNVSNSMTTVAFALANPGHVKLNIYNATGQKVMNVYEGDASTHSVRVPLNGLAAGVYFVSLEANGTASSEKLVVTK